MQFNINPILAKINDITQSNIMNIQVNQDNGTACVFVYNIGYMGESVNGQPAAFQSMLPNSIFKIIGDDYAAYSAANTSVTARFNLAAAYIAGKIPSIVLATS